ACAAGQRDAFDLCPADVGEAAEGIGAGARGAEGDQVANLVAPDTEARLARARTPAQAEFEVAPFFGRQRRVAELAEALVKRGCAKRGRGRYAQPPLRQEGP